MIAGYDPEQRRWYQPMPPTQISVLQMLLGELAPGGKLAGLLLVDVRGDSTTYGYIVNMMDADGHFYAINTTAFDVTADTAQEAMRLRDYFHRQLQPIIDWRREAQERAARRAAETDKENADGNN